MVVSSKLHFEVCLDKLQNASLKYRELVEDLTLDSQTTKD